MQTSYKEQIDAIARLRQYIKEIGVLGHLDQALNDAGSTILACQIQQKLEYPITLAGPAMAEVTLSYSDVPAAGGGTTVYPGLGILHIEGQELRKRLINHALYGRLIDLSKKKRVSISRRFNPEYTRSKNKHRWYVTIQVGPIQNFRMTSFINCYFNLTN